jgi:hypothetical protein
VLAATAVIAFYVHERAIERSSDVAKLEQQQPSETTATPPQAQPQQPVQAAPPAPMTPADVPARPSAPHKPRETEPSGVAPPKLAAEPDETAAAPPAAPELEALNGPASEREEYRRPPSAEIHGATAYALAPMQTPAGDKTSSEAAVYGDERKKLAGEEMEQRHPYSAKAATPSSPHDSRIDDNKTDETRIDKTEVNNAASAPADNPTAGTTEQVEVDAQQVELQPIPDVNSAEQKSLRLSGFSGALMGKPIHLPSGLPVLSIASSDHRMLAIDENGTLFFSDDSGLAWKKVKRQWTGHAILVRRKIAKDAAPAAAAAPGSVRDTTDILSHPETVFELVNDQSELWLSADGRIWTAK